MSEGKDWTNIISLVLTLISVIIPTVFFYQTSPAEINTRTYVIFGIIALVLIMGAFITYITSRWKQMNKDIKEAKQSIMDMKRDLDFKELFNKMNIRLSVLENLNTKKNKRAQIIDPRILFWIILIILLYLFLKSVGFFN